MMECRREQKGLKEERTEGNEARPFNPSHSFSLCETSHQCVRDILSSDVRPVRPARGVIDSRVTQMYVCTYMWDESVSHELLEHQTGFTLLLCV